MLTWAQTRASAMGELWEGLYIEKLPINRPKTLDKMLDKIRDKHDVQDNMRSNQLMKWTQNSVDLNRRVNASIYIYIYIYMKCSCIFSGCILTSSGLLCAEHNVEHLKKCSCVFSGGSLTSSGLLCAEHNVEHLNKMLLHIFWVQFDKFWATVRRT